MRSGLKVSAGIGLFVLLFLMPLRAALGQDALTKPRGPVLLTVAGQIERTNTGAEAQFDIEMLTSLGYRTMRTSTPWTDGTQEFGGILLRDILDAVGARGNTVIAVSLGDQGYRIEIEDLRTYPVLLATSMNGERLRIRDKGPLWIVYPRDQYQELWRDSADHRTLWHISRLLVE